MKTTADLLRAREAIVAHIMLAEDPLNHAEAFALLDEYADIGFEVGRNSVRKATAAR